MADAEFGDPAHPNIITNKDRPAINAARESAQRQALEDPTVDEHDVPDAGGETHAEYCRRTGQPLSSCEAG